MSRKINGVSHVIVVVFCILSLGTAWQVYGLQQDRDDAKAAAAKNSQEAAKKEAQRLETVAAVKDLAAQVKRLGAEPVVRPQDLPGAGLQGPQGEPGPPPSNSQVRAAVQRYCSAGVCRGPAPTAAQVAQAVMRYCNANGQCRGPQGPEGDEGPQGPEGVAGSEGPQGPPPSADQIGAAVNNYCAEHNNCQGPPGITSVSTPGCDTLVGKSALTAEINGSELVITCS